VSADSDSLLGIFLVLIFVAATCCIVFLPYEELFGNVLTLYSLLILVMLPYRPSHMTDTSLVISALLLLLILVGCIFISMYFNESSFAHDAETDNASDAEGPLPASSASPDLPASESENDRQTDDL
jgi:Ca2+/Na+ antiporter